MRLKRSALELLIVSALAVGVLAGAVCTSVLSAGVPREAMMDADVFVTVNPLPFDDEKWVSLGVESSPPVDLTTDATGRVTRSDCVEGTTLSSGDAVVDIDGHPVRVLATSVPLWRDLRAGDSGPDVSAVQTELQRLGVNLAVTGHVDSRTAAAVRTWVAGGSQRLVSEIRSLDWHLVLPSSWVLWSPEPSVVVSQCHRLLGDRVVQGDPVLGAQARLSRVFLLDTSLVLPDVSRTLTIGSVTVPLDEAFQVQDPDDLAALLETAELARYLADESPDRRLDGQVRLAEPLAAASVPPAAIIGLPDDGPCLVDRESQVTDVIVVSSQLGLALVVSAREGADLPERALVDLTGLRTCT